MAASDPGWKPRPEITKLLLRVDAGEEGARTELFELVYDELHRRAGNLMRRQPDGHTLQSTALVGEVYLRLFGGEAGPWRDRYHFLFAASQAMRHVLIDHGRKKVAGKRAGIRVYSPLDDLAAEYEDRSMDIEALQSALETLQNVDADMATAVELRFFGGASVDETAKAIGMSKRTFERRWQMTRSWLYAQVR